MAISSTSRDHGALVAGRYRLEQELGAGGMGVVFRARQLAPPRLVAIKFLHRHLARDPGTIARFRDECRAAASLDHPNTVAVLDHGEDAHRTPFLVMEYVAGRTLRQLADEGAMEPARAIAVGRQLLAALARAHELGVVHADVTSDNVLIEARAGAEWVKLVDFGLARSISGCRAATKGSDASDGSDDLVSGTPDYMAPEVILGGTPEPASDLYAVGVILYELVTGATPFGGGSAMDIMVRHVLDPLLPPSVRHPDLAIPRGLDDVLARALAKQPADRFPDAASFAAALESIALEVPRRRAVRVSSSVGQGSPTVRTRPIPAHPHPRGGASPR